MIAEGNEKRQFDVPNAFFQLIVKNLPKIISDIDKEANPRESRMFVDILMAGLRSESEKIKNSSIKILAEMATGIPHCLSDALDHRSLCGGGPPSPSGESYRRSFMEVP
jgi:hypothetical protein